MKLLVISISLGEAVEFAQSGEAVIVQFRGMLRVILSDILLVSSVVVMIGVVVAVALSLSSMVSWMVSGLSGHAGGGGS
jgi:hypothetical protein